MKDRKKPAIRFKGFTEDWEHRKLSELCFLVTKGTTPLDKSSIGTVNFVKIESIDEVSGEIKIMQKITDEEHNGYLRRSQLKKGDILFSIAGTLGRVTAVKSGILPANTNQALAIIRLKSGCLQYIKTYLKGKAVADFIKENPTIGAQPNLSLEQVGNLEISLPTENEQKFIGAYFQHLNNLITLHQRKYDKLVNVKKSMLEKIFPKNGESIPDIRFSGFTEDWEQRKLGEMMEVTSVKRILQSDWADSGVRFLRARDIVADQKNEKIVDPLYISKEKYDDYSAISGKVKIGDLLVTGVGTIGASMLIKTKKPLYFKDGNIIWFKNENKIEGYFFYYSFNADVIQNFIKESAGIGTVGTYTIESGKKTPIYFPLAKEEQEVIGTFFSNLDNLITLHQRKLEKLKNIKKSCLEKMFI